MAGQTRKAAGHVSPRGGRGSEIQSRVKLAIEEREKDPTSDPALVRTLRSEYRIAATESYREGLRQTFQESGEVTHWRWTSARTAKTCSICWAMDGKIFPVEVPLRSHPHCRCTMVPLVVDRVDRVNGVDSVTSENPANSINSENSVNSENSANSFTDLSTAAQKAILGARAFDVFVQGGFDLADLVGVQYSERFGVMLYRQNLEDTMERFREGSSSMLEREIAANAIAFKPRAEEIDRDKLIAANFRREDQPFPGMTTNAREVSDSEPESPLAGALNNRGSGSGSVAAFGGGGGGGRGLTQGKTQKDDNGPYIEFYTSEEKTSKLLIAFAVVEKALRAVGDILKLGEAVSKKYGRSIITKEQMASLLISKITIGDDGKTEILANGQRGFKLYFKDGDKDFWYALITNGFRELEKKDAKEAGVDPDEFIGSNPYFDPETELGQEVQEGAETLPENARNEMIQLLFEDNGKPIDMRRMMTALVLKEFTYGQLFYDARDRIVDDAIRANVTLIVPKNMKIYKVGDLNAVDVYVSRNWKARLFRIYAREREKQNEAEEIFRQISENNELARVIRGAAKGVRNVAVGWYNIATDPIGTVQALGHMALHPMETYEGLKTALGDKWEAFLRADYLDRVEMISELGAEIIVEILLTKGISKVAKTTVEIARLSEVPRIVKTIEVVDNIAEKARMPITATKEAAVVTVTKAAEGMLKLKQVIEGLLTKFDNAVKLGKKLTAAEQKIVEQLKAAKAIVDDAIATGKTTVRDVLGPDTIQAFTAIADKVINPTAKTLRSVPPKIRQQYVKLSNRKKLTELGLNKTDDAATTTAAVVDTPGVYTAKITWQNRQVDARPFGEGFWGKRTVQADERVNAFELKINPNDESYYISNPSGGYVQFENLSREALQDGKLVLNPSGSMYRPYDNTFLQFRLRDTATRQLDAANFHGLTVEWLVSDEEAVRQLTRFFRENNINVKVTHLPE